MEDKNVATSSYIAVNKQVQFLRNDMSSYGIFQRLSTVKPPGTQRTT
jgi:hypothetical protein